jgi:hypothetical protein
LWWIGAVGAVALLCAGIGAARADAALYWGSSSGIGAANLDGSNPQPDYLYWPYPDESAGPASGVAVNSEFLYWSARQGIGRRRLDGEGFYPTTVVHQLDGPDSLALDGAHIYWTSLGGHPPAGPRLGSLGRANLDGTEANNAFITGLEGPCGVAVDAGHIYWLEEGGIGRANLDGSAPERPFIRLTGRHGCELAASGGYLYWAQEEAIARVNAQGGAVEKAFIPQTGALSGIATGAGHIYWTRVARSPAEPASIGRANLDGSEPNTAWVPIGGSEPGALAVDERPMAPYLLLPSRSISLVSNLQYNLRSGAVLLGVYVPPHGPPGYVQPPQGRLAITSPGVSWTVFPDPTLHASQAGAALWQVRIRAGSGGVGRRIRAQLRRRGWARVKVRLTYEQERAYPVEATRQVTLRRYPGASGRWVKHPGPPPRAHRR